MEIRKFKKLKDGTYDIELDNGSLINVYEDLILKYDLLLSKQLAEEKIAKINAENLYYECYYVALKYLRKCAHSESEVKKFLLSKGFNDDCIKKSLEKLNKEGYLNDERYADSFVNLKISTTTEGPLKIKNELEQKNIKIEYIKNALRTYTKEIEQEKIATIVTKIQKSNHNKSTKALHQKCQSLLISQGFDRELIEEGMVFFKVNDEDIQKKEYEKLYKKLSRKYQGTELELQIRKRMYAKGFYTN